MLNSKRKGKNGENEFARFCNSEGFMVRRTAQYCGNVEEAADGIGLGLRRQKNEIILF